MFNLFWWRKRGLEQGDDAETLDSNQHVFTSVLQNSLRVYGPTEAGDWRRELNDTLNKHSACKQTELSSVYLTRSLIV